MGPEGFRQGRKNRHDQRPQLLEERQLSDSGSGTQQLSSSSTEDDRRPERRLSRRTSRKRDHGRVIQRKHQENQGTKEHQASLRRNSVNDDAGATGKFWRMPVHARLGVFNGSTSLETFLAKFRNCSEYFRWDERDQLFHLRASLDGPAGQLLWDAPQCSTVEKVVQLLQSRFGTGNQAERYRAELRSRRRQPNETLQSLYIDISRLMSLAYPGPSTELSELVARDAFLEALGDQSLRVRILEREPTTMDEALRWASRLEAYAQCGSQGTMEKNDEDFGRNRPKYVRMLAKNDMRDNKTPAEIQKQLEDLQSSIQLCRQELQSHRDEINRANTPEKRVNHPTPSSQGENREQNTSNSDSASISNASANPSFREQGRRARRGRCYECGQEGHYARDHRKQSSAASSNARILTSCQSNTDVYLWARLNGRRVAMLLDTGCERNICARRMLPDAVLEPAEQQLFAANGTAIPLLGQVSTVINVGAAEWPVTFVVTEAVREVILGMPFLTQNGCQWDFGRSEVKIGGKVIRLRSRPSGKQVRRIHAAADTVIPARHMLDLPVRTVWPNLRTTATGWIVEPRRPVQGVLSSRMLLNDAAMESFVRVINLSDRSCKVRQGTWMGNAEPVVMEEEAVGEAGCNGQAIGGRTDRQEQLTGPATHCCFAGHGQESVGAGHGPEGPEGETTVKAQLNNSVETSEQRLQSVRETMDGLEFSQVQCLIDGLPEELTEEEKAKAIELVRRNADVFSRDDKDIGQTNLLSHTIDTGTARPFKQQLRRHPQVYLPVIDEHVQDMLKRGIIEPASGPWASNVVLVKKSDGTLRFCIDFRSLNAVTLKDAYPLPRIDVCLESLGGSKYFSTLDAGSAYWQVPIVDEESKDKTAFVTRQGLWRFKVLAFGLCNAPAVFQRLMDIVLAGLQWQVCLAFLDDIMIYSNTFELHCQRLEMVLDRLRKAHLKLKPTKCSLFRLQTRFLGSVVSSRGIEVDPEKVRAVMEWPKPTNETEVRAFTALAGYYRRHIRGFAEIARPLHELTRKEQPFVWGERQQEAFEKLKESLVSAEILASPVEGGRYLLDTDASGQALGAVLQQQQKDGLRVIAYASRSLLPTERSYCTTRLELLGVVYGLRQFRHYLLGREFTLRTDNAAVTSLFRTPEPLAQQARWLDLLAEYNFELVHRPGDQHRAADSLSRRPCERQNVDTQCQQCRTRRPSGVTQLGQLEAGQTRLFVRGARREDNGNQCSADLCTEPERNGKFCQNGHSTIERNYCPRTTTRCCGWQALGVINRFNEATSLGRCCRK